MPRKLLKIIMPLSKVQPWYILVCCPFQLSLVGKFFFSLYSESAKTEFTMQILNEKHKAEQHPLAETEGMQLYTETFLQKRIPSALAKTTKSN